MLVHLISHTHWDREWYLPAARFRQLLVAMVDELIDDPPRDGASFLLDGQTVVLDDYLAVRPERAAELTELVRTGALEVGPWFVQADELIPGAEAFVRNLLAGRRALNAIGAKAPPVLYCPDTFGHPAALPMLARGFGCTSVIASRGYGGSRWPAGDAAWWIGPDGERVLFFHLSKSGYETGAQLPTSADAATRRWREIHGDLIPRSKLGAVLLMNGADHHARQARLADAIAALTAAAQPDVIRPSSLTAFGTDIALRAENIQLPEIRGELRDSYGWMWTLQGTFATRAHQKRRNARLERLLTRDVEPWVALATLQPTSPRALQPLLHSAWRSLILCHPHDTICGCSTDEVARAMDARLDEAETQALGLRRDAVFSLTGHSPEAARTNKDAWTPVVLVRNAAARPREGVALVRLTSFLADVKVGIHPDAAPAPEAKRVTPALAGALASQVLARSVADELTESPRHYPDDDVVAVTEVAAWLPPVPAYTVSGFRQATRARATAIPNPVHAEGLAISNGRVTIRVDDETGRVDLADHVHGRVIENLLEWESLVDLGDEYTPSPRGEKFAPAFGAARVEHRGPVRAAIALRWSMRSGRENVTVRARLIIDADARFVRIAVDGENHALDHRLRLRVATDLRHPRVFADSMFGPVERVPLVVAPDEARMELPLTTAPLHRYVSLFGKNRGATLYSDGLCEYEADDAGRVTVTIVRAVGELSRGDLPERPGNAGWPTPTPGAQCPGSFGAELALFLHGARTPDVVDDVERTSDDVLLPLTGATLRSALAVPPPSGGIELTGTGLAFSAAKGADAGGWMVLRCVNLLDQRTQGAWTLRATIREAVRSRLDEQPGEALAPDGSTIRFTAGPREVVTILAR
ncbi:MAG TPA: glycosyl hydrolase-related protein [Gemmatimonadaceae bacterium]|nr:glycosyl hydrolase-related protein [Gemmatimonadaceae bacterium]